MRKNLAVFGSDDRTLAKPLDCNAVIVMVTLSVRFCDDPPKPHPIKQGVVARPV